MNYLENYFLWKSNDFFDSQTKLETGNLDINNKEELVDRFGKELYYSKNGMFGEIGVGTNRINVYTIGKMSMAFALFVIERYGLSECKDFGVIIGVSDNSNSELYAQIVSNVLSSSGIRVYVQNEFSSTSLISYLIKSTGAVSGIFIGTDTKKQNFSGLKFYLSGAYEISDNDIKYLNFCFSQIQFYNQINFNGDANLIDYIDCKTQYIDNIINQRKNNNLLMNTNVKLAYLPFDKNDDFIVKVLIQSGFKSILMDTGSSLDNRLSELNLLSNEQNFDKTVDLAKQYSLDFAIATNLNFEKLFLAVKHNGEFVKLKSNEIGILIMDYFSKKLNNQEMSKFNVVKSYTCSNIIESIAKKFNFESFDCFNESKNIGEYIEQKKQKGNYYFGYNSNNEFFINNSSNVPDSVLTSLIVAEMISYHKYMGKTLIDALDDIYKEYGYFYEVAEEFDLNETQQLANEKFDTLTNFDGKLLGATKIINFESKLKSQNNTLRIIKYYLLDGSSICIETDIEKNKFKIFYSVCGSNLKEARQSAQKYHLLARTILDI